MEQLQVVEFDGMRVLTSQQIAEAYEADTNTLNKNFNRNKDKYIEGKHYICLQDEELKEFKAKGQIVLSQNINKLYLWTEKGVLLHAKSLNTDKAWEVYDRLVESYFRVRDVVSTELSPELQALNMLVQNMNRQELEQKRQKEQIAKLEKATETIKEAVRPVFDNWREEINKKCNRIQKNADEPFSFIRNVMYSELEQRAGCDLNTRLRNKRQRMADNGCTKTEINRLNKMDIIGENKQLREIFSKIVSEYEIKYCA